MAATLLYLLKANLVVLLFAAVYPALPVPALLPAATQPVMFELAEPTAQLPTAGAAGATAASLVVSWQLMACLVYAAGAGLLLLRLLTQLLSLARVRARARPVRVLGVSVRVVAGAAGPFSFGQTIYLSEATLADPADLSAALRHEQAHVRQHHTLDVLLLQLATALAWANPAAWLLRRAALDNLEYLADRAALQTGLNRRAYQYSLLHQQPGGVPVPALAFHFSFLTLKNRITMLNQPASTTRQLGRYLLAAPLAVLLALGYSGARAQTAPPATSHHLPANSSYFIDGTPATLAAAEAIEAAEAATPGLITRVDVLGGTEARVFTNGQRGVASVTAITTKANQAAPAVRNLDARMTQVGALVPRIEESELPAAAKAYITRDYADYRLAVVNKILPAAKQMAVYQAQLAKGRRPYGYLLFDAQGNFLEKI